jgi:hypothetical protein
MTDQPEPTFVRTAGRGGAVHRTNPDTNSTFCGVPAGRPLTETELNSRVPYCRACSDTWSSWDYKRRSDEHWTPERLRAIGRSADANPTP